MNPLQVRAVPSWIVFQLNERCNLRCSMCYEWGTTGAYHAHQAHAELDPELVLRTVVECAAYTPYYELFGGEPLLYAGLFDVIAAIVGHGSEVSFPTNGTLLERHAEALVAAAPTRVWVSLDGPPAINDAIRGRGIFEQAVRGLEALVRARSTSGRRTPAIGVNYVVTPTNAAHVSQFFLESIDLSTLDGVSIELQNYATTEEHEAYAREAEATFGVFDTPHARAFVRDPAMFGSIDLAALVRQMGRVGDACRAAGVAFRSQPRTVELANLSAYFGARWSEMADRRHRCAFPWTYAEVSARGAVTTCHGLYDVTIGNLHEATLGEIWQGSRAQQLREHLRDRLFPICTACCRYHDSAPHAGA